MFRNYPIRFNRNSWRINFFSRHVCGENICKHISVPYSDSVPIFIQIPNPEYVDEKCPQMNSIERSYIQLKSFNKEKGQISHGRLLEKSNEIVIPDRTISVIIDFPVSNIAEAVITSRDENGFTLRDILGYIKHIYRYIYMEEERTANSLNYTLSKFCERCISRDSKHESITLCDPPVEEECSICCENFASDSCGHLKCGHTFHRKCIEDWLDYSSNCPLCRQNSLSCQMCNGTYIVYYDYTGVVIPVNQRGLLMLRNHTDGTFGIGNYDFEDLILKSLEYNRVGKRLYLDFAN